MTPQEIELAIKGAQSLSRQDDRSILIVFCAIVLCVMGWMIWFFLKKIEKKDNQVMDVVMRYSTDSSHEISALAALCEAVKSNTQVMERIRDGLIHK